MRNRTVAIITVPVLLGFSKYHALGNDFIVVEKSRLTSSRIGIMRLTRHICNRHSGVGADGLIYLSPDSSIDGRIEIYNADGSRAEKSGNGLRIAAEHCCRKKPRRKTFVFQTSGAIDKVVLKRKISGGHIATTQLGQPEFEAQKVPVKTRRRYLINYPLKIGPVSFPVTCLAVGNPHTVLVVEDFDFDWQELGEEIEHASAFPNRTNVEFVRIVNRGRLRVAEWERGAGATGSSGTGAAAAVCAMVMLGLANRRCEVQFETGSLLVEWNPDTSIVELTGPTEFIMEGRYEFVSH